MNPNADILAHAEEEVRQFALTEKGTHYMEIQIVAATLDLADSFWRALDLVARERRYLLFTEAPPVEETREFVSSLIANGSSQFYAVCGTDVVGWCDIIRSRRAGMTHSGHLGIGVIPAHRGRGIGVRLLKKTVEAAFARGLERIELEVFASNRRAFEIYLQFGFVEEGRKRRARFIDGDYDDLIMMGLLKETPNQAAEPSSFRLAAHD
jgi:RimJ/RimL family protein N-acetyltransferase